MQPLKLFASYVAKKRKFSPCLIPIPNAVLTPPAIFWWAKFPDPKSQVEQITIALIYKFMDDLDAESEELGGKRAFFVGEFEKIRVGKADAVRAWWL